MVTYWKLINKNTSHLIKFVVLTIRNHLSQKEFFTTTVSRDLRNRATHHLPIVPQPRDYRSLTYLDTKYTKKWERCGFYGVSWDQFFEVIERLLYVY